MTDFRTPDLGLASYLVLRGHELLGLEGWPGDRSRTFRFPAAAAAEAPAYFAGAAVPAVQYNSILRGMKARLLRD